MEGFLQQHILRSRRLEWELLGNEKVLGLYDGYDTHGNETRMEWKTKSVYQVAGGTVMMRPHQWGVRSNAEVLVFSRDLTSVYIRVNTVTKIYT